MIIKKLTLHNFGVYALTNVFEFHADKPIVLIGGMNGRGKTTFLEAVLLALYGSNSFAYIESKYSSFGQYLKSFVNTADGTLETYVDLEFALDAELQEVYRIHRTWSGKKQRVFEDIQVFKDGEYNAFLTDNWTMFIENILPSGLSNFFFFDGEKIAELAVESTSTQMKESIKTLLGISVLDHLKGDLGRIINRTTKNHVANTETEEIEQLREKKDLLNQALSEMDSKISELEKERDSLDLQLEQKRKEYSAKGGDIVTQRQELFNKRSAAISKMETYKEQLIADAGSELPLILVKQLLWNVRENAEVEQDLSLISASLKKMKALFSEYAQENNKDIESVARFIDFVHQKSSEKSNVISYNLSDTSLFKLQMLLDEQLLSTKLTVADHRKTIDKFQEEIDQLDSYMAVDIDEKEIARVYRKIKEIEQKRINLDVQISSKEAERKTINGNAMSATSEFNKRVEAYLKRVELNDDGERIIKYSHMANAIIEEFAVRLQKKKIRVVADTMTLCYKKLANKKNLIDRIEMDPVTLDLKYIDSVGKEVNRSSLSAGEKQLMVISLLWALAKCSKKKLPVIIDTPLSRLDSAHRVSLIQTYFPKASEQTIILSTDSEIDRNYYEIMKDNIGDEFTLVYDDASRATTIRRGYFVEER